jgi:6-pyruvoyltetrahydropterin/6-carboxytetrahydropterin synthase
MYFVTVRDHIMIAHSLRGEVFGPAQRVHGATYVVDAEFRSESLDANNIVIDIGIATASLKEALEPLNYRHLDELPRFKGAVTTTEFLARHIHRELAAKVAGSFAGTLKVTLLESHVAAAGYEGPV